MGRQSAAKKAKIKAGKGSEQMSKMAKARKAAVSQMNPALAKQFDMLENKFRDLQGDNIRFYYNIGKVVKEIQADQGKYVGNDGTPGMELLEAALVTQARTLRRCGHFARDYTPDEMEELVGLRNDETGSTLHWGHVMFLLGIANKALRTKMAYDAVARAWDPNMLHERIKKALGRAGGHGRTHTVPTTVEKQVKQIRDVSATWLGKQRQVWNGPDTNVFNNVLNAGKRQITPEVQDYLNEAREQMVDIADAARENVRHIEGALVHVGEIIEERAAATVSRGAKGTPHRDLEMSATG